MICQFFHWFFNYARIVFSLNQTVLLQNEFVVMNKQEYMLCDVCFYIRISISSPHLLLLLFLSFSRLRLRCRLRPCSSRELTRESRDSTDADRSVSDACLQSNQRKSVHLFSLRRGEEIFPVTVYSIQTYYLWDDCCDALDSSFSSCQTLASSPEWTSITSRITLNV